MSVSRQFVLPFVARSEKRKEAFSSEAEIATVFVLSELERKNGRIANKQERSAYILKVGYPLWFIVKENSTYVFDGLDRISYNWTYYETSQIDDIIRNFEAKFRIHEHYIEFLDSCQSFQQTLNNKKLSCEGLIANNTLLSELNSYRREVTEVYDEQIADLLLPIFKETEATKVVDQIETLQLAFKEKTEKLKQLLGLISKTTKGYIEGFNFESKAVTEEAEAKIKAQKEIINPKIEKISNEYKKKVERLDKNINKECEPLEKQKSHIEKVIKERENNIKRYSKQAKIQAQRGNKRSEESLKQKIKREKQESDELQKQHKKIEKQLKKLAEHKTDEILRLKHEFDEKIQAERKPISSLETLRDEKQEFFKQESNKLENLTQRVLEELDGFVIQQEKRLTNIEPLSLESDPKLKNNALVYIPFYIVSYGRAESNLKRYFVFPPALVYSLGFSSKLKGALRMTKIKDLLNERFKAVSALGEELQLEISSNSRLEAQIEALTHKNNILNMKTPLKNGLLLLREEGWLSETDYQMILSTVIAE
jgi:hypothetical protein